MNKFSNNNSNNKKYDLEERTAEFGEKVIELCKKAPKNAVTIPIIDQLIRSGTSIGANYCEANGASKGSRRVKGGMQEIMAGGTGIYIDFFEDC